MNKLIGSAPAPAHATYRFLLVEPDLHAAAPTLLVMLFAVPHLLQLDLQVAL